MILLIDSCQQKILFVHFVSAMASLAVASVEYTTLRESLGDLNDCLLGNVPVITLLSTQLFVSHLIPRAVHDVATNIYLPTPERANKLLSSVLAIIETHNNPSKVFSFLITSLKQVGLNDIATKLEERLSKLCYYADHLISIFLKIGNNRAQQEQHPPTMEEDNNLG